MLRKHLVLVCTLLLLLLTNGAYAETEREAIINHTQNATWAYYTDTGASRWYISTTSGYSKVDIYSLGPISNNGTGWWTVGSNAASIDLINNQVMVDSYLDSISSDTFYDVGLKINVTDRSIHSDRQKIQGTTVPIKWYFFQAPNGAWYIVNAPGYGTTLDVRRFAEKDGQYDWPPVDVSGVSAVFSPSQSDNGMTVSFVGSDTGSNKLILKWPLATTYANRSVNQFFGVDWSAGVYCNGLIKKHNGTDFQASAGTAVYAAEDGIVKEVHYDSSGLYAYNIVLEHTSPIVGKYTTVYWHVNPATNVSASNPGGFVQKGMQIATVANLGSSTHFHLGVRLGAYMANLSGTGALPQTDCGIYPAFPAGFIDPNDTNNILFQ